MSTGDTIFKRLRSATDAELRGIARILELKLSGDREVDVVSLSKAFRSAAGNSFANIFRSDHELDYRLILEDAVVAAAEAAGFRRVAPDAGAREAWLEEYIVHAMYFATRPDRISLSADQKADAQRNAEAALNGKSSEAGLDTATAAGLGVLAAGGVAIAFGIGALPFGVAYLALKYSGPALKKTLPATQYLVHVRKRLEAEEALREGGT